MTDNATRPTILVEIRPVAGYWRCAVDGLVHPPRPLVRAYVQEARVFARACLHHPLLTLED